MEITINVTEEEKKLVIEAIETLNSLAHLKYMSQAMISNSSSIKPTKVRAILIELIKEGRITQYAITDNPRLQRYYYVVNQVDEDETASVDEDETASESEESSAEN